MATVKLQHSIWWNENSQNVYQWKSCTDVGNFRLYNY